MCVINLLRVLNMLQNARHCGFVLLVFTLQAISSLAKLFNSAVRSSYQFESISFLAGVIGRLGCLASFLGYISVLRHA